MTTENFQFIGYCHRLPPLPVPLLLLAKVIDHRNWTAIHTNVRLKGHLRRRNGHDIQAIARSSINIVLLFVDIFELQLLTTTFIVDNGPTDVAFASGAKASRLNGITARTVVVSEEPGAAFKTDSGGIIKEFGLKVAFIVFISHIIERPSAVDRFAVIAYLFSR